MELTGAGDHDYDGIPYGELDISDVIWISERQHHIEQRSRRKVSSNEVNIKVEWTVEAVADPGRMVRNARSRSGLAVQLLGRSPSAGRVLAVYLTPAHRPPRDVWYGATARIAAVDEREDYERHQP